MWFKYIIIFLLFYLFAVLQSSFFAHFNFLGTIPDLVFILFFSFIFFSRYDSVQLVFLSIAAGLFSDVFSSAHIGTSVILLMAVGFLAKKTHLSFKETKDSHPFIYFASLFIASFVAYKLLLELYFWSFTGALFSSILQVSFFAAIIYNLIVSSLFFYVFKRFKIVK